MVKRTYNLDDKEPEQQPAFEKPSEREHLFQVSDIFTSESNPFKNGLPVDTVAVKCEVVGGDEAGRTILQRLSLDENWKGFFATKLFLKAIDEPYKGAGTEIDTDNWQAHQFYATVVHNGDYANIDAYNFDKKIDQAKKPSVSDPKEIQWEN